jgi:hypothetical protein
MSFINLQEFECAILCIADPFEPQVMSEAIEHVTACEGHEAVRHMVW